MRFIPTNVNLILPASTSVVYATLIYVKYYCVDTSLPNNVIDCSGNRFLKNYNWLKLKML